MWQAKHFPFISLHCHIDSWVVFDSKPVYRMSLDPWPLRKQDFGFHSVKTFSAFRTKLIEKKFVQQNTNRHS